MEEQMDQSTARTHKRKVYLINPRFQLTFVGYFMFFSIMAAVIYYVSIVIFFRKFAAIGMEVGLPADHVFFKFISDQQHTMDIIFLATSIVMVLALCIGGILLSHKVAGPVYRLSKHFKETPPGEMISEVKFREGDFFPELPVAINDFLKNFRERQNL